MTILECISTEKLNDALAVAFFYADGSIAWIMIYGGEIIKRIRQRPVTKG